MKEDLSLKRGSETYFDGEATGVVMSTYTTSSSRKFFAFKGDGFL
tara:strand:- start:908 stop:1042 length:135 start_codon:yes stop_codon:yes gene_type:complete